MARFLLIAMLTVGCVTGCGGSVVSTRVSRSLHGPGAVSAMNGFALEQSSPSIWGLQLAAMEAHGVWVVRSDAPWAVIEPEPPGPNGPVWQFSQMDAWVKALASHDLTWEPIIDYGVGWAYCPGACAPARNGVYATFAQAVAARYGVHGSFWSQQPKLPYYPARIFEIWNEEGGGKTLVPAARYASLYATARGAIHAVDPQASVIVGGLGVGGPFNADQDYPAMYVEDLFAADPGLRGNVDGFGLHPYGAAAMDAELWVVQFRHTLDTLGEGSVPIDITEVGWPTGDQSQEDWRASMMSILALNLSRSNCGIRLLAPYDWINPGDPDNDFGFVAESGHDTTLRPAGAAWFQRLKRAASLPESTLCDLAVAMPVAHP